MTRTKGIGGHHQPNRGRSDDWITPRSILDALGQFDLDPCACNPQPWPTARTMWASGGLDRPWDGRVWLNPPYGPDAAHWIDRLAAHGDGMALLFARTETIWFVEHIWDRADAILFLFGRLTFHRPDGTRAAHNSGGPSCLVAYGYRNALALTDCGLPGHYVGLRRATK